MTALLNISENANRVLNTIKVKYQLKDKSQVVEHLVNKYIEDSDDRELRPEFIEELKRASKEKGILIGSSEDFRKRYLGPENVHAKSKRKSR